MKTLFSVTRFNWLFVNNEYRSLRWSLSNQTEYVQVKGPFPEIFLLYNAEECITDEAPYFLLTNI